MRYVIEGEWTGYVARQQKIVHREVVDDKKVGKAFVEKVKALRTIVYTDGTSLYVTVRAAKPREKVDELLGYRSLIRDAARKGGARVCVVDMLEPADE